MGDNETRLKRSRKIDKDKKLKKRFPKRKEPDWLNTYDGDHTH